MLQCDTFLQRDAHDAQLPALLFELLGDIAEQLEAAGIVTASAVRTFVRAVESPDSSYGTAVAASGYRPATGGPRTSAWFWA